MNVTWQVDFQEEVDSTNVLAAERVRACWAKGESAHGVAVWARRQKAGRGQHGRAWASPEGGVYLSAVLEELPAGWRERLALVVGVTVMEALEGAGGDAATVGIGRMPMLRSDALQIRWPNDVLLGGRKVAGILCEGISQGERFAAIVGIGINVHTRMEELPAEVRGLATSLWEHGVMAEVWDVAVEVLEAMAQLLREGPSLSEVVEQVRRRDALLNQTLHFNDGERVFPAMGAGLEDDGSLLLQLPDGTRRAYSRGSILPHPPAAD